MTEDIVKSLFEKMEAHDVLLATAESCTGGLISAAITAVPGASSYFERGFVTYTNRAKTDMLGVPADLISAHGAVSAQVAERMASGALAESEADITVSCTGIAGPGGGTAEKPVGLVYIGLASDGCKPRHFRHVFEGSRKTVREQTVEASLSHLNDYFDSILK